MSEQILEQVSAFLDGELPKSETELLLKRLTRDAELRERFGRYALIGETLRGTSTQFLSKNLALRVSREIDGVPALHGPQPLAQARAARWWRPIGGVAVAAGVAAVAIVALQQRALLPAASTLNPAASAQNVAAHVAGPQLAAAVQTAAMPAREALSYTVPTVGNESQALAPARLTNYVLAHSRYSSPLGQRGLLTDMLIDDDDQPTPRRDDATPPYGSPNGRP